MAFSGGVDSSVLLAAACRAVKASNSSKPVLAVTFATRLHPHGDTAEAEALARTLGATHQTIEIDEFSDSRILSNPKNRCYLCKSLLFHSLLRVGQMPDIDFSVKAPMWTTQKFSVRGFRLSVRPASTVL